MKLISKCALLLCLSGFLSHSYASNYDSDVEIILETDAEIYYAQLDLYLKKKLPSPRAIIILAPGVNRNGTTLVNKEWLRFSENNQLNICATTFCSKIDLLKNDKGYYDTSRGSGDLLLQALQKEYKELPPLLMFGFSGGAHFVSSFVQNYPDHIMSWCAYSAAWWGEVQDNSFDPPGIIACGELDAPRIDPSFNYFKEGRKLGYRWSWIKLQKKGHARSDQLEDFVRDYFLAILNIDGNKNNPVFYDLNGHPASVKTGNSKTDISWFPNKTLISKWLKLHVH